MRLVAQGFCIRIALISVFELPTKFNLSITHRSPLLRVSSVCFSSPVINGSSRVPLSVAAITAFAAFLPGVQGRWSYLRLRSALNRRLNHRALPSRDVQVVCTSHGVLIVGRAWSVRVVVLVKPVRHRQSKFRTYCLPVIRYLQHPNHPS